jgi:hypothetical protein
MSLNCVTLNEDLEKLQKMHNSFTDTDKHSLNIRSTIDKLRYHLTEFYKYKIKSLSLKSNNDTEILKNMYFTLFFDYHFKVEPGTGPISISKMRIIFRSWLITQPRTIFDKLGFADMLERIRIICDNNSTDTMLWGIKERNYE